MQRAMGGMEPPVPPTLKSPPKQSSVSALPQQKESTPGSPTKDSGKKPPVLAKQQSITSDTGNGATPPATPKQKTPATGTQQPDKNQPGTPGSKPGLVSSSLQKPLQSPKGSPQPSPAKTKDAGSFFGGFSLGGFAEKTKPPAAELVSGKLFGGFGGSPKTQSSHPVQVGESLTGKLFSGSSGITETAKHPVAPPQTAEVMQEKMFGFGSSILSSATNLMTGEVSKSSARSAPDSSTESSAESPQGSPPDSESPPDASPDKSSVEGEKAIKPTSPTLDFVSVSICPLCKVNLNMSSGDVPNYSTCTGCQKIVCNLCGFNPTPHLSEVSTVFYYYPCYSV